MTTNNLQTRLLFDGGWATDFGPTAHVSVGQDGTIQIPYLVDAENCVYNLDGGPFKIGGTERINSSALNGGTTVRGLFDFWVLGATGAAASQHLVVHVGDEIMKDNGDGSFASILGGIAARDETSVPSYAVYDDDLIIMSDISAEVPLKWTGAGDVSVLGTNTPDCAFGIMHKNRFFMAGDVAKKSRVYYSEPLPNGADGDWDEIEAGFFDVDPNDSDEVRGLASHKGILWIFKGPYKGSIHTLMGDTPLGGVTAFASSTQPVPFELDLFIRGVGAAGHNSIFRFRDDIGFIDAKTGSIRSLNATDKFGDFREASLSFPINDFLLKRVNKAALKGAWTVQDISHGSVLLTIPLDTSSTNTTVLNMDYRFDPPRWSHWPAIAAECLASVIDSTKASRETPFIGDTSGFVRRTNIANRSIDGTTSINYKVTLPHLDFGNPVAMKTIARVGVGVSPRGDYNGTFGWERDDNAQQTTTFSQGGGDVLAGATTGKFITVAEVSGSNVKFTTFGPHPFSEGDRISISGVTPAGYNGERTVDAVGSTTTFEVEDTFISDVSGSNGLAEKSVSYSNFFIMGASTLSGTRFVDRFFALEEGGEFRTIQFQVTQSGLNEDIAIHSFFIEVEPGADSMEN